MLNAEDFYALADEFERRAKDYFAKLDRLMPILADEEKAIRAEGFTWNEAAQMLRRKIESRG